MTTAQRSPARSRLLEAADRVLFDRGIRGTPVDELLQEAGVSAATLYTHFGSKDALVAEALRMRLAEWRTAWDRCIIAATDDLERLLAVFDALATYRSEQHHPARWCACLAAAAELPATTDAIGEVLAADTALLADRLVHLSRPVAGQRAHDLADEVLIAYSGALAAFLRGAPAEPIEAGRRLARSAAGAYRSD
ncbi:TetR/AcrR family transcriptional regulator [Hoyosella sp. G463]|uniref:TetR/AcrR family transcriptional regulator n=1 Tax=Lolliginicoccus lacisalsi TaxID=2742202 RepID=A0A927J9A4_9ACTN|nr:TetR/AcrR family transcriptional regulator [Lolliginicoccus lacisalsi]